MFICCVGGVRYDGFEMVLDRTTPVLLLALSLKKSFASNPQRFDLVVLHAAVAVLRFDGFLDRFELRTQP